MVTALLFLHVAHVMSYDSVDRSVTCNRFITPIPLEAAKMLLKLKATMGGRVSYRAPSLMHPLCVAMKILCPFQPD